MTSLTSNAERAQQHCGDFLHTGSSDDYPPLFAGKATWWGTGGEERCSATEDRALGRACHVANPPLKCDNTLNCIAVTIYTWL